MGIFIRTIYDPPGEDDGLRYLVESVLPEGVEEAELSLSGWLKELAPSDGVRAVLDKGKNSWKEFCRLYYMELLHPSKEPFLALITEQARVQNVTLVFDAPDPKHNHAMVLKTLIELRMRIDEDF